MATLLDFQACTNAALDRKPVCDATFRANRQRLEKAGLGLWIEEYVVRLRELEGRRPPIGGDLRRFAEVRAYREAVARLSLAMVTAIALDAQHLDEGIRASQCDSDVDALFRIAMQCQVIDDVVDYGQDLSAGLPSFLTASASLPQALDWTAETARSYGATRHPAGDGGFPLRVALRVVTGLTTLVVRLVRRGAVLDAARASKSLRSPGAADREAAR